MTKALVATLVCAALAACGGKGDDKKKDEGTPASAPPTGPPTANPPGQMPGMMGGGLMGGGALAGLFGGATAAKKKESPVKGLFGGGLNIGAIGQAAADSKASVDPGAPPAPPAPPPPPPDPGKPAEGASCAAVAQHVAILAKEELGDDAPKAVAMLSQMCEQQQWPAEARSCFMNAGDESALEACGEKIGGSGDGDGDGEDPGGGDMPQMPQIDMTATAPVPSGNPDCDAMAVNLVAALMAGQMGGQQIPPEARQMMEQMKIPIQNQIAAVCVQQKWPKPAIQCLGSAKSEQDLQACVSKYNLTGG
jgi:hypothetical protein